MQEPGERIAAAGAVVGSGDVHCYAEVDETTGQCGDYLDEGVDEEECCQNIKYAFKRDASAPCQGCRPASWSQWSNWSPCTVSCLEGVRRRTRVCIGQGDCEGNTTEVEACTQQDCCPRDGDWTEWSAWTPCSVTCKTGQQERSRTCSNPTPFCGGSCLGDPKQVQPCDTNQICPTHGQWGAWGGWEQCSATCVAEGSVIFPTQSRFRVCNNPPPSTSPPGNPCPGNRFETRDCTSLPLCPVAGGWGSWQSVSECSVTCGLGRIRQERSCNSPAPRNGGDNCPGSPTKHIICRTSKHCPIDGTWSEWDPWTTCKRATEEKITCLQKVGFQQRKKSCRGVEFNGKWCDGSARQDRRCYNVENCFYSSKRTNWSEWSPWGLCEPPCGPSVRKRYRECLPIHEDYPLIVKGETKETEVFFWGTPRFQCVRIDNQAKRVEETSECKNTFECL
ncbi:properdin-like isoform X1 [Hyperolius riggenbachi]|uniref:properdin-like isoform X1 n=1 Tax=Hyperolius riggenbachi TaxID=752182 RepID=UPI0035A342F6